MTEITLAPVGELVKMAHWAVDRHDEWDMPHEFVMLKWENGKLVPGTVVIFAGDIDPYDYPATMGLLIMEELKRRASTSKDDEIEIAPCALLLTIEGYGVTAPLPDASEEEKEQFDRDRIGRTFKNRSDRREMRMSAVADLTGRLVTVTRYRDTSETEEQVLEPGDRRIGGRLPEGLVRVAIGLGHSLKVAGLWDGR